jgi:hypothetical protein
MHSLPVRDQGSDPAEGSETRHDAAERAPNPWVLLAQLPRGHDLRTRPLGAVNAECRNKLSENWRKVGRWCIGAHCYDDLGSAWTDTSEFRAPASVADLSIDSDGVA